MAFDKKTRNELGKMVTECRRLLTDDVRDQFQRVYGIQPDGSALDVNKLKLDDRGREIAESLQQWLNHLAASEVGSDAERREYLHGRDHSEFRIADREWIAGEHGADGVSRRDFGRDRHHR